MSEPETAPCVTGVCSAMGYRRHGGRCFEHEIARLKAENALARDTAFWLDCRWEKPSDEPRGASTCGLEGTHVCALCLLADARAEIEQLKKDAYWVPPHE